jgi:hypothetical protein
MRTAVWTSVPLSLPVVDPACRHFVISVPPQWRTESRLLLTGVEISIKGCIIFVASTAEAPLPTIDLGLSGKFLPTVVVSCDIWQDS